MFDPSKLSELLDAPVSKPDIFDLQPFIAWMETKQLNGAYCYGDNGNCLIAQYFKARGILFRDIGGFEYWDERGEEIILPESFFSIAVKHPRTFGAALQRARAYAAKEAA